MDDFRRFEEMMNRMFEDFWGDPQKTFTFGERGDVGQPGQGTFY